jgi:hypothetical protein
VVTFLMRECTQPLDDDYVFVMGCRQAPAVKAEAWQDQKRGKLFRQLRTELPI